MSSEVDVKVGQKVRYTTNVTHFYAPAHKMHHGDMGTIMYVADNYRCFSVQWENGYIHFPYYPRDIKGIGDDKFYCLEFYPPNTWMNAWLRRQG